MQTLKNVEIAVIGAGAWGTTLAKVLAENWPNKEIMLWVRRQEVKETIERTRENPEYLAGITLPYNIHPTNSMEEAVNGKEVLVFAVPSLYVRSLLQEEIVKLLKEERNKKRILVNTAKGAGYYISRSPVLLAGTTRVDETVRRYCSLQKVFLYELFRQSGDILFNSGYVTLSGPSFAREVAEQIPTRVVAAGTREEVELVDSIFSNPYFFVEVSNDVSGVEICGALKNVVAIAVGMADGLDFGDNAKVIIAIKGMEEIGRLALAYGADHDTLRGPAGLGDLMLTCMGKLSRNKEVGRRVASGEKLEDVLLKMRGVPEGVYTLPAVMELVRYEGLEAPVARTIYQILYENISAREALTELIRN